MEEITKDIKHIDRACDALAQASWELGQTHDWVALSALKCLEGMLDDLGDRHAELKGIKDVVRRIADG